MANLLCSNSVSSRRLFNGFGVEGGNSARAIEGMITDCFVVLFLFFGRSTSSQVRIKQDISSFASSLQGRIESLKIN